MHLEPRPRVPEPDLGLGPDPEPKPAPKQWDIFCKVIDNYGDIGVCWRLASDLASRGQRARLWVDDPSPLAWMAPDAAGSHPGVQVISWTPKADRDFDVPGDVVIEAFGCELPPHFIARMASTDSPPAWINLEYLSAEPFVERCHGLPSPVMSGLGRGLVKHFFYPGFTPQTGGLLRELDLPATKGRFDRASWRRDILARCTRPETGFISRATATNATVESIRWVSLFCYEPHALTEFLAQAQHSASPVTLLVTAGRAQAALQNWLQRFTPPIGNIYIESSLSIFYLPQLTQTEFDALLWACDANFVRGEDSLVRALWSGAPLVWQIYPQDDGAHHDKLAAFLDAIDASAVLREWHMAWNASAHDRPDECQHEHSPTRGLPPLEALWADTTIDRARTRLHTQHDLCTQLMQFVAKRKPAKI